jgi:hypothetical protein
MINLDRAQIMPVLVLRIGTSNLSKLQQRMNRKLPSSQVRAVEDTMAIDLEGSTTSFERESADGLTNKNLPNKPGKILSGNFGERP